MNKSLNFVKQRIMSGNCAGMEIKNYSNMFEVNTRELCRNFKDVFKDDDITFRHVEYDADDKKIHFCVDIKYDPDYDFEDFITQRCISDGTYFFFLELSANCLNKIMTLKVLNNNQVPHDVSAVWLNGKNLIYTIGNFVWAEEIGQEFSTNEKPWMMDRMSAILPIKLDIITEIN